jgi:hypothetical protein
MLILSPDIAGDSALLSPVLFGQEIAARLESARSIHA